MTVSVYSVPSELTSPRWAFAFAQGCGGRIEHKNELLRAGPVALFGSPQRWAVLQDAIAKGRDWYYGDHAYFGRGRYYRCTKNAYQHTGDGKPDYHRFAQFGIQIKPWRKTGRNILICPNSPGFFQLHGTTFDAWINDVERTLRQQTDRPIIVRWKRDARAFDDDLRDAWAVVVYTSNAAVEAALAGVPVFATAPCAGLAFGSGDLARIETPDYPDADRRRNIAGVLAANQWTLLEYRRGHAWKAMNAAKTEAA